MNARPKGNFFLFHWKLTIKFTKSKQISYLPSGHQGTFQGKTEREEFVLTLCQKSKILRVRRTWNLFCFKMYFLYLKHDFLPFFFSFLSLDSKWLFVSKGNMFQIQKWHLKNKIKKLETKFFFFYTFAKLRTLIH